MLADGDADADLHHAIYAHTLFSMPDDMAPPPCAPRHDFHAAVMRCRHLMLVDDAYYYAIIRLRRRRRFDLRAARYAIVIIAAA